MSDNDDLDDIDNFLKEQQRKELEDAKNSGGPLEENKFDDGK
jgi:hypothetical protein